MSEERFQRLEMRQDSMEKSLDTIAASSERTEKNTHMLTENVIKLTELAGRHDAHTEERKETDKRMFERLEKIEESLPRMKIATMVVWGFLGILGTGIAVVITQNILGNGG